MFLPFFYNIRAALPKQAANLRDFVRLKPPIERNRKIIDPHFTFFSALEHVHVNALREIVAVKADPTRSAQKQLALSRKLG
jgi:hypothetical protein